MTSRASRLAALEAQLDALTPAVFERDGETVRVTFGDNFPALVVPRDAIPEETYASHDDSR